MRICTRFVTAASLVLLPAGALRAQGLDVTGSWSIQMQTLSTASQGHAPVSGCGFQGTTNVNQTGSQFTGGIDVNQASGPGSCPSAMSATVSGTVAGSQVSMGAVMGSASLGQATFTGTITPAAPVHPGSASTPAAPVNPGSTITGTFSVTSGPFNGTGGTWSATKLAAVAAVPALGARGLTLLALLLLGSALWLLWRRSASAPR
jgi:hypothetical protein